MIDQIFAFTLLEGVDQETDMDEMPTTYRHLMQAGKMIGLTLQPKQAVS